MRPLYCVLPFCKARIWARRKARFLAVDRRMAWPKAVKVLVRTSWVLIRGSGCVPTSYVRMALDLSITQNHATNPTVLEEEQVRRVQVHRVALSFIGGAAGVTAPSGSGAAKHTYPRFRNSGSSHLSWRAAQ